MADEKMLDKIKKLLRLSESANEHEAKLAAERAAELMLKHKLTLQQVSDHDDAPPEEDMVRDRDVKPWMQTEDKFIYPILGEFFFVHIVYSRRPGQVTVNYLGRESDVAVARYVYDFLFQQFRSLFKQFKRDFGAQEGDRQSYYYGLEDGLEEQLRLARARVEEEMALVVVDDGSLSTFVRDTFPRMKAGSARKVPLRSPLAEGQGRTDGRKMSINRGVGNRKTQQIS